MRHEQCNLFVKYIRPEVKKWYHYMKQYLPGKWDGDCSEAEKK